MGNATVVLVIVVNAAPEAVVIVYDHARKRRTRREERAASQDGGHTYSIQVIIWTMPNGPTTMTRPYTAPGAMRSSYLKSKLRSLVLGMSLRRSHRAESVCARRGQPTHTNHCTGSNIAACFKCIFVCEKIELGRWQNIHSPVPLVQTACVSLGPRCFFGW